MIGIDEGYEEPINSHIEVNTNNETIEQSYKKIIDYLEKFAV